MNKLHTYRIDEDTMNIINSIAVNNNTPKGHVIATAINVLNNYFTEEQIGIELQMLDRKDGRRKKFGPE